MPERTRQTVGWQTFVDVPFNDTPYGLVNAVRQYYSSVMLKQGSGTPPVRTVAIELTCEDVKHVHARIKDLWCTPEGNEEMIYANVTTRETPSGTRLVVEAWGSEWTAVLEKEWLIFRAFLEKYGWISAKPTVKQATAHPKRKRGVSADVLDDCKKAMEFWLDKAKPLKEASELVGRDDETVLKRMPNVLEIVDADTRAKWIKLIRAQRKEKYLGKFTNTEDV